MFVTKKKRFNIPRPVLVLIALLVIAGGVVFGLEITDKTYIFHSRPSQAQSTDIVKVGKPVEAPRADSSDKKTDTPTSQPTGEKSLNTGSTGGGGATDTKGAAKPTTPSSQWTTSQTGYLTVKSPAANGKLKDGSTIVGSAKVAKVSYRLIDNVVGVLAQGELNVVDGNFSGTLHFQAKGTGGRLDVFSTNDQGVEYNEVQINVEF